MSKIVSLEEAIAMIPDGANVCVGGFVGCMHPEALTRGIEENFLAKGSMPRGRVTAASGD